MKCLLENGARAVYVDLCSSIPLVTAIEKNFHEVVEALFIYTEGLLNKNRVHTVLETAREHSDVATVVRIEKTMARLID